MFHTSIFSPHTESIGIIMNVLMSIALFLYARLNKKYYAMAMFIRLSARPSVRPSIRVF